MTETVTTMYFGWQEAWPILVIVVILFGARRLPELAHAVGESLREFKKATSEVLDDDKPVRTDRDDQNSA